MSIRFKLLDLKTLIRTKAVLLLVCLISFLPLRSHAIDIPIADTPCDPDYYSSLQSRAWLEAQREITQNQNLIFKPDSVLEYSCFPEFLSQLATNTPTMFSENPRWGNAPIGNMTRALGSLVYPAVLSHVSANFTAPSPNLLGGRAEGLEAEMLFPSLDGYNCDIMNQVWMEAKCMDFINNEDHDGFYTFEQYATGADHRFLPAQCVSAGLADRWRNNIDTALGKDQAAGAPGTPWQEDIVNPYIEQLLSSTCGNAAIPPLYTGVQVRTNAGEDPFDERVCVQPGCHYDHSAGECTLSVSTPN